MEKGEHDLNSLIGSDKTPLSFLEFFPIFRDCIISLAYIHNKNVAHRDIKPANILKINHKIVIITLKC